MPAFPAAAEVAFDFAAVLRGRAGGGQGFELLQGLLLEWCFNGDQPDRLFAIARLRDAEIAAAAVDFIRVEAQTFFLAQGKAGGEAQAGGKRWAAAFPDGCDGLQLRIDLASWLAKLVQL